MTNFLGHRCQLDRHIIRISGPDRISFLQGLVSCDITKAAHDNAVYGAFLTPQGKFLHDFFCLRDDQDNVLIDIRADRAEDLIRRLRPFRLRSQVTIDLAAELGVVAHFSGSAPASGWVVADPRLNAMGWREITDAAPADNGDLYHQHRLYHGIGEAVEDIVPEQTILLEANFDVLNGIDLQKGCYMGQEVTARSHYRGLVKKRLFPCRVDTPLPVCGSLIKIDNHEIGEVRSGFGQDILAFLRVDRALENPEPTVQIDGQDTRLTIAIPDWLAEKINQRKSPK